MARSFQSGKLFPAEFVTRFFHLTPLLTESVLPVGRCANFTVCCAATFSYILFIYILWYTIQRSTGENLLFPIAYSELVA
jgi:hypothetical protein